MTTKLSGPMLAPANGQAPDSAVVLLHGYGRDASLMKKLADEVQARLPQALVLMPQAPEEYEACTSDEGHALRHVITRVEINEALARRVFDHLLDPDRETFRHQRVRQQFLELLFHQAVIHRVAAAFFR